MNVVVEERTKEIGIKMALGARDRWLLRQLLLETLLITGHGRRDRLRDLVRRLRRVPEVRRDRVRRATRTSRSRSRR